MDDLYIDYKNGILLGKKLQEDSNNLINLLNSYNDVHEKLKHLVDDTTYEKYGKLLSVDTKIMCKLSEVIMETGNVLINISSAYEKIENLSKEEKHE